MDFQRRALLSIFFFLICLSQSGCSLFVSSKSRQLAHNISTAVLSSKDLGIVKTGLPAYILFIDGLLQDNPNNIELLLASSQMYTAYTGLYLEQNGRAQSLSQIALTRAMAAACQLRKPFCAREALPYQEFQQQLSLMKKQDLTLLYALGSAWALSIQTRPNDWAAVAKLSYVTAIMDRIIELDASFRQGGAHIYLGVLSCLLPDALGGRCDDGGVHFDKAIRLSHGNNLMVKVLYAKYFARLKFDKNLHDELLQQVLAADPSDPLYNLNNVLAKEQATTLLAESDDYF